MSASVHLPKSRPPGVLTFDLPFGPAETEAYFQRRIGPIQVAFGRLDRTSPNPLAEELVAQWSGNNKGDDRHTLVETEYLEVRARWS